MNTVALPVRRALTDVTFGRGAFAFWLCLPLVLGALLLLRDSSVVAVNKVTVVGLDGYYERGARKSVTQEALTMSTLNVDADRLRDSLGEFVDIAGLQTKTDFPHGLTVIVAVRRAVASARVGNTLVGLTGTGAVLESTHNLALLPRIEVTGGVKDNRLLGRESLRVLSVLGAAPDVMLRRIDGVSLTPRGITVKLDKGTLLYFGDQRLAADKWRAAVAVLADPKSKGARYVDLRIADRPAIGGLGAAPVTIKPQPIVEAPAATAAPVQAGAGATAQTTAPAAGPTGNATPNGL